MQLITFAVYLWSISYVMYYQYHISNLSFWWIDSNFEQFCRISRSASYIAQFVSLYWFTNLFVSLYWLTKITSHHSAKTAGTADSLYHLNLHTCFLWSIGRLKKINFLNRHHFIKKTVCTLWGRETCDLCISSHFSDMDDNLAELYHCTSTASFRFSSSLLLSCLLSVL